jgi:hypothetical protein
MTSVRGALPFDVELDAPQAFDRYVEHEAFGVRDSQTAIGHDHKSIASRWPGPRPSRRARGAACRVIVHGPQDSENGFRPRRRTVIRSCI